jgi:hypothetical protein
MLLKQLGIVYPVLLCLVTVTLPVMAVEVRAGSVVVDTDDDGDVYVNAGGTEVYVPNQRYYPRSKYRPSSRYRYPSYYCKYGSSSNQYRTRSSWSGRTVMRSSVYSSQCRY